MLEQHIQALGGLTQKKIAEATDSLRLDIVGQGEQVEKRFTDILALFKGEIDSLSADFAKRLDNEEESRQGLALAGDKLWADMEAKVAEAESKLTDSLNTLTNELDELDTCFAEKLQDALEKQRIIHVLEIDKIKEQLLERQEAENSLSDSLQEKLSEQRISHGIEIQALKEQISDRADIDGILADRIENIKDGEKGDAGDKGEQGEDGQDRPLLQPVELADRDYDKNTLGTYDGALWISTKNAVGTPETDPHAWHCILDAIKDMEMDLEPDGTYKLSVRMATGRQKAFPFEIPYPEHCGIWEERGYRKGQIVTKGNSMWQAMEDTSGTPPGNGWRQILSAPRGKPGAAGKSIEGPQGKPGRNGRDVDPELIDELRYLIDKAKSIVEGGK